MCKNIFRQKLFAVIYPFFLLSLGLVPEMLAPKPSLSADNIRFIYGPFNCSLSVESLETYAKTGEITPEFRFYTKFLDKKTLAQLRHWLQKRFDSNHVELHRYTRTPEGEELLQELGTVLKTHSERNGFYALRAALVQASANQTGWTIIDVIHKFPTDNVQINTGDLFKIQKFWQEQEPVVINQ
ncbi:MAG: alpha/beta hydrolase [Xenococcaceae cyanobacterium MO_188.B32]|nr:alpha/beta hydrolase [Xenococcaceae cyanobacterium MO_188.B32]